MIIDFYISFLKETDIYVSLRLIIGMGAMQYIINYIYIHMYVLFRNLLMFIYRSRLLLFFPKQRNMDNNVFCVSYNSLLPN